MFFTVRDTPFNRDNPAIAPLIGKVYENDSIPSYAEVRLTTFEEWKDEVNRCIIAEYGVGCDALPDVDYQAMFNEGQHPADAALDVVAYAKEG